MYNIWDVYKFQSMSIMHDICNNKLNFPFLNIKGNTAVHEHFTKSSSNLHIETVTTIDKHNFVYYSFLKWNACPHNIKCLPRFEFIIAIKMYILRNCIKSL